MMILVPLVFSCSDMIDCGKYEKDYIDKMMSPADSLMCLEFGEGDFGSLKMSSVFTIFLKITNKSDSHTITVYSLKQKNTTGLFLYSYPHGMPFTVSPGEDTELTEKIAAKCIADVFDTDYYYDTLIVNENENFYIPVKVKIRY